MSLISKIVSLPLANAGSAAQSRPSLSGGVTSALTERSSAPSKARQRRTTMIFVTIFFGLFHTINPALADSWISLAKQDIPIVGSDSPILATWPDAVDQAKHIIQPASIKIAPSIAINSGSFENNGQTFTVTVALIDRCDNGANNAGSGIERSLCEVRVTNSSGSMIAKAPACYSLPANDQTPAPNKSDRTEMSFDHARNVLHLRTSVGGKFITECNAVIALAGLK
jgi:hypothetical protein